MKAVQYETYGGPDVLRLVDVPMPEPGRDQVRIAVRAAGVNPSDWKRREGQYRAFEEVIFPAGLGVEASGVIDAIGPGVSGYAVGDAVFGYAQNAMAEYAVLTGWVKKPAGLSFEVAAGLAVAGETAWRALDDVGVVPGETLLIDGAAGGIGGIAVQLARLRGVTVIGTASAAKHDYLRSLGAMATTYGLGLAERVRAFTPKVDAALDIAGAGVIPDLIGIVGDASRVVSVADFSAGAHGARFSAGPPRDPERVLGALAQLCVDGRLRLPVERTFPLEETAEAQAISAGKGTTGKLIIVMGPPS